MRIADFLHVQRIIPELKSNDKKGVVEELSRAVAETTEASVRDIARVLLEREQLGSTGIGGGIAIPHGKLKEIDSIIMAVGLKKEGIEYDSLDNKPVYIFFLLLTPEHSTGGHLKVLAQISKLLKSSSFKNNLKKAQTSQEVMDVILAVDENF